MHENKMEKFITQYVAWHTENDVTQRSI